MKTKKPAVKSRAAVKNRAKPAKRSVKRRPLHRRVLIHPATIFTLLCVGVFITGWTLSTKADNINVTGKVAASGLTQGAVITQPADGAKVGTSPINVTGTCPANSYVKIYRNSLFSGSAWCSAGQFSLSTALSPGVNTLEARDFNITDDPGPATPPINVTYTAATSPTLPPNVVSRLFKEVGKSPTPKTPSNVPLLLTANYSYKSFAVGGNFQWAIDLEGGTPPYVLQIDWGDGSSSVVSPASLPVFSIKHIYHKAGYFPVVIRAVDSQGRQAYLQISALIRVPGGVGFADTKPGSGQQTQNGHQGFFQHYKKWLPLAWGTYGIIGLMALSFWLGERQEQLQLLRPRYTPKHR